MHFLRSIIRIADIAGGVAGRLLSWFLPVMTFATLAVIFFGTVFRVGWVWLPEAVVYMHAMLFTLGAAHTLRQNEHVRIDIFYNRLSLRGRAIVDLGGTALLLMPVCTVIIVYSLPYVISSWRVLEHSPEGNGLPAVFLLKTCIPLFAALLILEGLSLAAKSMLVLMAKDRTE